MFFSLPHYKVSLFFCSMNKVLHFFFSLFRYTSICGHHFMNFSLFECLDVFLLLELIIYEKWREKKTKQKPFSHCRRLGRHRRRRRRLTADVCTSNGRTHETRCLSKYCFAFHCIVCFARSTFISVRKMSRRKEMTIYKKSNSVSFWLECVIKKCDAHESHASRTNGHTKHRPRKQRNAEEKAAERREIRGNDGAQ